MPEGSEPSESAKPIVLDGFQLIEKLGSGAMGSVFRALQLSMDRMVAIKILSPELAENRGFLERFRREAHAAGRLSHPNIVTGIDVGHAEGVHYFAMEYVDGESLMDLIKREGAIEEKKAAHIGVQIARALDHAHEHGILHRDVKPQNVLLSVDGPAKLCDLGLVRHVLHSADGSVSITGDGPVSASDDLSLTREGSAVGTPYYLSPEQALGEQDIDGRSDIYSLGATLFHAVSGEIPFKGSTASTIMEQHINEPPPPVRELAPEISHRMAAVIEKCLEKDPDDRYLHAEELADDLERIAAGKPPMIARAHVVLHPRVKGKRADRQRDYETDSSQALRAVAAAEKSRHATIAVVVSTVAAALFIMGIVALSGRRGQQPPPRPTVKGPDKESADGTAQARDARLRKMYDETVKWADDHPDEYTTAIDKLTLVRNEGAGTEWERKASSAMRDIRSRLESAAETAFADIRSEADALASRGDYDKAIKALEKTPAKFAEILEPLAEAKRSTIHRTAQRRVNRAISAAEKLSEAGEPDKGLASLDALAPVKYAATDGRIALLRDKLKREMKDRAAIIEKKRAAASKDKLAALMNEFDAAADDPAQARLVTSRALRNRDLTPVMDGVRAAAAVADALEKIQKAEENAFSALLGRELELRMKSGEVYKGKVLKITPSEIGLSVEKLFDTGSVWAQHNVRTADLSKESRELLETKYTPKTPDEGVAAAIRAMARKDLKAAEKALAVAGSHPLAERYRKRLEAAGNKRREDDARLTWMASIGPLFAKTKFWKAEALRAGRLLTKFEKDCGDTEFGKDKVEAIARLRIKIAPFTGEPASDMTMAVVSKAFKGKVESFDGTSRRAKVVWDLSSEDQLTDFGCETGRHGNHYREGRLSIARSTQCHRAGRWKHFSAADVTLTFDFSFTDEREEHAHISVGFGTPRDESDTSPKSLGQFVFIADRKGFALANIGSIGYQKEFKRMSDTVLPDKGTLEVSHRAGKVTASLDGKTVFEAETPKLEKPLGAGISIGGGNSRYAVTGFTISGVLDKTWFEKQGLDKVTESIATADRPTGGYTGAWTRLEPEYLSGAGVGADAPMAYRPGIPGVAYDSRRKCTVLCGGGRADMWAFVPAKKAWICLEEDLPGGETQQRTLLAYDSGNDRYWMWSSADSRFHAYDPSTHKWEEKPATSETFTSLGYSPLAEKLFALGTSSGSARGAFSIDPSSGTLASVKVPPFTGCVRGTWMSAGAMVPDGSGRFLFFSGLRSWKFDDRTWLYDSSGDGWREVKPETIPPPRMNGVVTYHSKLGIWVLFGGIAGRAGEHSRTGELVSDTWAYDAALDTWIEVKTRNGPESSAQQTFVLVYDEALEKCMLVGYRTPVVETWTLSLTPKK